MSNYRQLHTRMWSSDSWFIELKPEYKLLFIYLFSNERASVCGLYEIPIRIVSFETGLSRDQILAAFEVFIKADKIKYDFDAGVIWVKNMLKYQGSSSPKLQARIKADINSVPDCDLKSDYLNHIDTISTRYVEGRDTSYSVSVSESISGFDAEEEEGVGGETTPIPEGPAQAMKHPDIQAFQAICGRIPGARDYALVIETIQLLRAKHGAKLTEAIKPFWLAWSTRKTQGGKGKPYDPASLVWLTEWSVNGEIPRNNGAEPSANRASNQDIIRKVAQHANRSTH